MAALRDRKVGSLNGLLVEITALVKARRRKARDEALDSLRVELANVVAPDVSAFLDWCATHEVRALGPWRFATSTEMRRKPKTGAAPHVAPESIAHATGTLYLGKDGSGARFFVERDRVRSEVFIHDPGAGQLAFLADSLSTFAEMNALMVRWERFCEEHDVDPDPEEVAEIAASTPGFAELRAQAKALKGRVNLADRSDFDETMEALAKTTFRAKPKSTVLARYLKAKHA